jgi:fumarylacetoacetate (FAA) hydrolase family protein
MAKLELNAARVLPVDAPKALLIGRAWTTAGAVPGPSPVLVREGKALDLSRLAPTMAQLLDLEDLPGKLKGDFPAVGTLDELLASRRILSPVDLQAIKASGVTFVQSLMERVIEEQARGDPSRANAIRARIDSLFGGDLSRIKPGSPEAMKLKEALVAQGAWSQYLEVGIGPDAEIFTKTAPMASVGPGADIGILRTSTWNNPEPEIVLVANGRGAVVAATLGNDVNLRDVEGRSALLLGRAKDNNASAALGPFLRVFDPGFGIEQVRKADIALTVEGEDGFRLEGKSSMSKISRDPLDIMDHARGRHHQYPDGLALYLGTMFAPVQDRGAKGEGFTHNPGDVVTISTPTLGALVNTVRYCDDITPWSFGTGALMRNLAQRGLL